MGLIGLIGGTGPAWARYTLIALGILILHFSKAHDNSACSFEALLHIIITIFPLCSALSKILNAS